MALAPPRSALQIFKDLEGKSKTSVDFAMLNPDTTQVRYRCLAAAEKFVHAAKSLPTASELKSDIVLVSKMHLAHVTWEYLKLLTEQPAVDMSPKKTPKKDRASASRACVPSVENSVAGAVSAATNVAVNWEALSEVAAMLDVIPQYIAIDVPTAAGEAASDAHMASLVACFKAAETTLKKRARDEKIDFDESKRQGPKRVQPVAAKVEDVKVIAAKKEDVAPVTPSGSVRKKTRSEAAVADVNGEAGTAAAEVSAAVVEIASQQQKEAVEVQQNARPNKFAVAKSAVFTRVSALPARLRTLQPLEKKLVSQLNAWIAVLAAEYANEDNRLNEVFSKGRAAFAEIWELYEKLVQSSASELESKQFAQYSDLLSVILASIDASEKLFNSNESYQSEFDEYLLHPIAHACLDTINTIEGFCTEPCRVITEKEIEERNAMRNAAQLKMDAKRQNAADRDKARVEAHQKKEEEIRMQRQQREEETRQLKNQLQRPQVDERALTEDTLILNPTKLGYILYDRSVDAAVYSKVLECWSVLVSVPRALKLSQFPFALFFKTFVDGTTESVFLEEVFRALLDLCLKPNAVSRLTPLIVAPLRAGLQRGKSWFETAVEFMQVTSGNKKKKPQKKVVVAASSSDSSDSSDDSDDSSTSDSDDDDDGSSESESSDDESKKGAVKQNEAVAVAEETPQVQPPEGTFECEVFNTLAAIKELGPKYASWSNLDISDKVVLFQYCVNMVMDCKVIADEAEKVAGLQEAAGAAHEKKIKEILEEAQKELKGIKRAKAGASPVMVEPGAFPEEDVAVKKARILAEVELAEREAFKALVNMSEVDDLGVRIRPLGMDRYRRAYWRFPFDKFVLVETTTETTEGFPMAEEPVAEPVERPKVLLDDDDEPAKPAPRGKRGVQSAAPTPVVAAPPCPPPPQQRSLGFISADLLPAFVMSLDVRGKREARLRLALEPFTHYLKGIAAPPMETGRMTRSRAAAQGYQNKLKDEE